MLDKVTGDNDRYFTLSMAQGAEFYGISLQPWITAQITITAAEGRSDDNNLVVSG
ncbi:hypothetical protein [Azospirillum brasilense]|uniref:hypothetical protein n=1 Tax=Azospirillum brasilense TaxID=192 RepID=UPI001EDC266D|nr:hypothetical protein [Azospirillum brasilense]UKJ75961.1 hypothetical protein H1Q64_17245 [Azospirillum brasilense]